MSSWTFLDDGKVTEKYAGLVLSDFVFPYKIRPIRHLLRNKHILTVSVKRCIIYWCQRATSDWHQENQGQHFSFLCCYKLLYQQQFYHYQLFGDVCWCCFPLSYNQSWWANHKFRQGLYQAISEFKPWRWYSLGSKSENSPIPQLPVRWNVGKLKDSFTLILPTHI